MLRAVADLRARSRRIKGREALRAAFGCPTVIAGLATFGAYALVLAALQRASAPSVAADTSASPRCFAWLILREHVRPERLAGAGLVAGGVALLSLT